MSSQFLRNTRAVLEVVFSAGAADGPVIATVRGEDGTVLGTGTATHDLVTLARYTFALAPQAELNRTTTTWAGTWGGIAQSLTTDAEVVGGHLFTVAEARAFGDKALAGSEYTDEDIRETRDRVTDDFQLACGVPFFPRFEHQFLDGPTVARGLVGGYTSKLWLPYKRPLRIVAVKTSGVAMSAPDVAAIIVHPTGRLELTSGMWPTQSQSVEITWERGYRQVPEPVKRAALMVTHYELVNSEVTDRMVSVANELGTVRLSVPGRQNPTGIPLVDSVLYRYDERDYLVAMI